MLGSNAFKTVIIVTIYSALRKRDEPPRSVRSDSDLVSPLSSQSVWSASQLRCGANLVMKAVAESDARRRTLIASAIHRTHARGETRPTVEARKLPDATCGRAGDEGHNGCHSSASIGANVFVPLLRCRRNRSRSSSEDGEWRMEVSLTVVTGCLSRVSTIDDALSSLRASGKR
jgi:hypothetical protein